MKRRVKMRARPWTFTALLIMSLASGLLAGCSPPPAPAVDAPAVTAAQDKGGQEEFGPYEPVPNWPQPLPDGPDGLKHDGWTWGSVGAVYAESPDRIWIAQRGELPLPAGAAPWTPYAMLNPSRGSAGGSAGITTSSSSLIVPGRWSSRGRSMTSSSRRRAVAVPTRSR